MEMLAEKIRVLVVDDSPFARQVITRYLQADPSIQVIGSARNGLEAVQKTEDLKPDVVTLDVQMPVMDGIEALEGIMTSQPTPVVMLSTLTGESTEATIRALELGAIDFFLKPAAATPAGDRSNPQQLRDKVIGAALSNVACSRPKRKAASPSASPQRLRSDMPAAAKIIAIGSSTGGPRALSVVVPSLPADLDAGVLIVQHMPPGFTRSLAERLNQISRIRVKEAEEGDVVFRGMAFIAPGDYHMTVTSQGVIALNKEAPAWGLRPAVDVTMRSVAGVYRRAVVAAVLTGMGSDGTAGTTAIRAAGGLVLAQDEETSAVWGMPKSVVEAGNADSVLALDAIGPELTRAIAERKAR